MCAKAEAATMLGSPGASTRKIYKHLRLLKFFHKICPNNMIKHKHKCLDIWTVIVDNLYVLNDRIEWCACELDLPVVSKGVTLTLKVRDMAGIQQCL